MEGEMPKKGKNGLRVNLTVRLGKAERERFTRRSRIAKRLSRHWDGVAEAMRDLAKAG